MKKLSSSWEWFWCELLHSQLFLLRTMDGREVALAKKFIDNQIFNSNQEGSVTMTMTLGTDTLLEESLSEWYVRFLSSKVYTYFFYLFGFGSSSSLPFFPLCDSFQIACKIAFPLFPTTSYVYNCFNAKKEKKTFYIYFCSITLYQHSLQILNVAQK